MVEAPIMCLTNRLIIIYNGIGEIRYMKCNYKKRLENLIGNCKSRSKKNRGLYTKQIAVKIPKF